MKTEASCPRSLRPSSSLYVESVWTVPPSTALLVNELVSGLNVWKVYSTPKRTELLEFGVHSKSILALPSVIPDLYL